MGFLTDGLLSIGGWLLHAALPALATAGAALALRLLQQQLKRVGLELTKEQQEAFRRLVENVIVRVEEMARRAATAGEPWASAEKREVAKVIIREQAPGVPDEVIDAQIDAMLPKVRQIIPATASRPAANGKVPPTPSTPASFGRH